MPHPKIDTTEWLVLSDLCNGRKLYYPFHKQRSGKSATAFIWDGHSDRRTVYMSTIKALIKKEYLIETNRNGLPFVEYRITDAGIRRSEQYKTRKKNAGNVALSQIAFAK